MSPKSLVVYLGIGIGALSLTGSTARADSPQVPAGLEDASADWVQDTVSEIDATVERIATAYGLDEASKARLREEMIAKVPAQWQHESQGFRNVNDDITKAVSSGINLDDDTPETRAIAEKFYQLGTDAPLNDLVVVTSIEAALPKEVAVAGHQRLQELLDRRAQLVVEKDNDVEQQADHNAGLMEARAFSMPPLSAQGNALPRGEKLTEVAPGAVGKAGGEMPAASAIAPGAGAVGRDAADAAKAAAMGAVNQTGVGGADVAGATGAAGTDAQAAKIAAELKAAADAAAALEEAKKAQAQALAAGGGAAAGNGAVVNPKSAKRAAERVEAARIAAEKAEAELAAAKTPGGKGADRRHDRSNHDAGGRESAARPMPKVEAVRATQAPPLDDWDKHVDATCKKFGFSDAQVIKAQSILKDLRQRAEAYRKSRDDEFAAADRLADAKAKADRKAELAKPIDALFEELKQRLDNLATAEQRAKAVTEPAKGAKK